MLPATMLSRRVSLPLFGTGGRSPKFPGFLLESWEAGGRAVPGPAGR